MIDVELLARHINALNVRTRHVTEALQQHGDHLLSFVKVIDNRTSNLLQGIKINSNEIQNVAKFFQNSLRSLEQSTVNMSQYLISPTNNFNNLRSNIIELKSSV